MTGPVTVAQINLIKATDTTGALTYTLADTLAAEGKQMDEQIDGYTEAQRYFIGFAQVWCDNTRDATARQSALTDPHSPGKWRVDGTVQNFDAFGKAFGCTKGQPMYPVNSCRVW